MIKFFRKIRQNLLSEGKIGKYMKYAVGEIILVVLGILIALGLNNWNEQRKSENAIYELIKNIESDIQENNKSITQKVSFVLTDSLSRIDRFEYMLKDKEYKKIVELYWNYIQDYYAHISNYRAQSLATLGTIKIILDNYDVEELDGDSHLRMLLQLV